MAGCGILYLYQYNLEVKSDRKYLLTALLLRLVLCVVCDCGVGLKSMLQRLVLWSRK